MMRRNLGLAMVAAALIVSCGSDENNGTTDNNSTTNVAPNNTTNTTNTGTNTANNDAAPWSATVTGVDDLSTADPTGSAIVIAQGEALSTVTGTIGAGGATLSMTFADTMIGVGEFTASTFKLGFATDPAYQCTSDSVTVTFTSDDPWVATFEGPVSCALTDQTPIEGTISGRFEE